MPLEGEWKTRTKVESKFLTLTDYSPKLRIKKSKKTRLFELRTYTAAEGMLSHLDYRFANDTIGIFDKHGMTNVAYWHPMSDQDGHGNTLIYLLAYKDAATHKKAWAGFRTDPEWKKLRLDPKSELEVDSCKKWRSVPDAQVGGFFAYAVIGWLGSVEFSVFNKRVADPCWNLLLDSDILVPVLKPALAI